jgi:hypothetical protein
LNLFPQGMLFNLKLSTTYQSFRIFGEKELHLLYFTNLEHCKLFGLLEKKSAGHGPYEQPGRVNLSGLRPNAGIKAPSALSDRADLTCCRRTPTAHSLTAPPVFPITPMSDCTLYSPSWTKSKWSVFCHHCVPRVPILSYRCANPQCCSVAPQATRIDPRARRSCPRAAVPVSSYQSEAGTVHPASEGTTWPTRHLRPPSAPSDTSPSSAVAPRCSTTPPTVLTATGPQLSPPFPNNRTLPP